MQKHGVSSLLICTYLFNLRICLYKYFKRRYDLYHLQKIFISKSQIESHRRQLEDSIKQLRHISLYVTIVRSRVPSRIRQSLPASIVGWRVVKQNFFTHLLNSFQTPLQSITLLYLYMSYILIVRSSCLFLFILSLGCSSRNCFLSWHYIRNKSVYHG